MLSTCQKLDLKSNQMVCIYEETKTFILPLHYTKTIRMFFFIAIKDSDVREIMVIRGKDGQSELCHQLFLSKDELLHFAGKINNQTRLSVTELISDLVNQSKEYDELRSEMANHNRHEREVVIFTERVRSLFVALADTVELNWNSFIRTTFEDSAFQSSHFRPTGSQDLDANHNSTVVVTWDNDDFDPSTTLSSVALTRRCIPGSIREKIFDPSSQDLVGEYLEDIASCKTGFDRFLANTKCVVQLSVIILECARIWVTHSAKRVLGTVGFSALVLYIGNWIRKQM